MALSELSQLHGEGLPNPDPTPGGFYSERDESNFYVDPDLFGGVEEGSEEYLTAEDAAVLYGYTIGQMYNLVSDGSVVYEKRPVIIEKLALIRRTVNKIYVSRTSLESYINTRGYNKRSRFNNQ